MTPNAEPFPTVVRKTPMEATPTGDVVLRGLLYRTLVFTLLYTLFVSPSLLDRLTGYTTPGGVVVFKMNFYTYLLFAMTLLVIGCSRPGHLYRLTISREGWGHTQFLLLMITISILTVLRQGFAGLAFMVDTLLSAPIAVLLTLVLSTRQRIDISRLIIWFILFNAAVCVAERVVGVHVFHFEELWEPDWFRSTGFLGHPLANAMLTGPVMMLVLGMPWKTHHKVVAIGVCLASIMANGARAAFVSSLVQLALLSVVLLVAEVNAGRMSSRKLTTALTAAAVGIAVMSVVIFQTNIGSRIFGLAKFDASAAVRVDLFQLFESLSQDDILFGVSSDRILLLLQSNEDVPVIENFWVAILLSIGVYLFIPFVCSFLYFVFKLCSGRGLPAYFAITNFLLIASSSNSLSVKTCALYIMSLMLFGLPRLSSGARATKDRAPSEQALRAHP